MSGEREPDGQLRARLMYVAGDTAEAKARISEAGTVLLDQIAETLGLRRRAT